MAQSPSFPNLSSTYAGLATTYRPANIFIAVLALVCCWQVVLCNAEATSCSEYCVQSYGDPGNRTSCIYGCVLGYNVTQLSQCVSSSSAGVLGCSRVIRCYRCVEGGCDTTQDAFGFLCTVPKAAFQQALQSGSTAPGPSSTTSSCMCMYVWFD